MKHSVSFGSSKFRSIQRLMFRPGPSRDSPTYLAFLHGKRDDRASFANRLSLLLERVVRRNYHVGTVPAHIHVRRVAERDHSAGDAILLGIGLVVADPLRTGPRTVPLVGRKFIEDGCLIGASRQHRLCVALVEAVYKLPYRREHCAPCGSGSLCGQERGRESRQEESHEHIVHPFECSGLNWRALGVSPLAKDGHADTKMSAAVRFCHKFRMYLVRSGSAGCDVL
jgi:hypothetical protein